MNRAKATKVVDKRLEYGHPQICYGFTIPRPREAPLKNWKRFIWGVAGTLVLAIFAASAFYLNFSKLPVPKASLKTKKKSNTKTE